MVFIVFLSSRPFCRRWRRASAAGWCCGLLVLLAAGSGWTLLTFTDRRRPTSSASGVGLVAASSTVGCCGHPGPQVLVHLLAMGGAAGGAAGRSIILLCSSRYTQADRIILSACSTGRQRPRTQKWTSMLASLVFLHKWSQEWRASLCVCVCGPQSGSDGHWAMDLGVMVECGSYVMVVSVTASPAPLWRPDRTGQTAPHVHRTAPYRAFGCRYGCGTIRVGLYGCAARDVTAGPPRHLQLPTWTDRRLQAS